MPFIGLYERIGFSAYFLWMTVLAVALWRTPTTKAPDGDRKDHTGAPALQAAGS
jgi:hypothetical protein